MELQSILELVAVGVTIVVGFAVVAGPAFTYGERKGRNNAAKEVQPAIDTDKQTIAAQIDKIEQLTTQVRDLTAQTEAHGRQIVEAFSSSEKIWRRYPAIKPQGFDAVMAQSRTKIVTIGNLKGGVGKTTLTVNLAAYFALTKKKKVLVIDLDYQGSASNTLRRSVKREGTSSNVDALFGRDGRLELFGNAIESLEKKLPDTFLIPSSHSFDDAESKAMMEWFSDAGRFDARYHLSRFLCSKEIRDRYEVVLIDTPPRLSTGMVNALCASTHLLVPTKLDVLSAEAVAPFLSSVQKLITDLNPHLRLAGVVGTMTRIDKIEAAERDGISTLQDALNWFGNPAPLFNRILPTRSAISEAAGRECAYTSNAEVKGMFDAIGEQLWQRLNA